MKTKELIQQLQELDPEGDIDVIIDGVPVWTVEDLPAYYDGLKPELIQLGHEYFDIIGYRYTSKGRKISLRSCRLSDALVELMQASYEPEEDIRVEIDAESETSCQLYLEQIKKEIKLIKEKVLTNEEVRDIKIIVNGADV